MKKLKTRKPPVAMGLPEVVEYLRAHCTFTLRDDLDHIVVQPRLVKGKEAPVFTTLTQSTGRLTRHLSFEAAIMFAIRQHQAQNATVSLATVQQDLKRRSRELTAVDARQLMRLSRLLKKDLPAAVRYFRGLDTFIRETMPESFVRYVLQNQKDGGGA
jgi:hypothetical protein